MQNEVFNWVTEELAEALPESWEKVALYVCFVDRQPSMNLFAKTSGEYKEVLTLGLIPEEDLVQILMAFMRIVNYDRGMIPEGKEWTRFSFLCERESIIRHEFGHDEILDDAGFESAWKEDWLV